VVGLLGGSFNPAHEGHRHISLIALQRMGVDEVWWMVSPQNPLKSAEGMDPLSVRMATAQAMARHPKILVTAIESRLNTRYTADTLQELRRLFPNTVFIWMMGADNLAQIPRWERWTQIFRSVPVAVFDRTTYSFRSLAGKAARRFARWRVPPHRVRRLSKVDPPAWTFLHSRLHPASATGIRALRQAIKAEADAETTDPKFTDAQLTGAKKNRRKT
jgi:nicotinate-nucleotide adenylyltransferase